METDGGRKGEREGERERGREEGREGGFMDWQEGDQPVTQHHAPKHDMKDSGRHECEI